MNEEYGLSSHRMEQQLMIKNIVNNINPEFTVLFQESQIQITANNNINRSLAGVHQRRLDLHKVSDCIQDLIQIEKEIIDSGIIPNQFTTFTMESSYFRITFDIKI